MREYPDRPWVGIGVVVHRGDEVLLIKRGKAPNKGKWSLPGGAQDVGETVFQAALREVMEETTIRVSAPKIIDVVDSITHDPQGKVIYHYTLIEVGCEYDSGTAIAKSDAEDVKWVMIKDLEHYALPDITLKVIRQSYLSRKDSFTDA